MILLEWKAPLSSLLGRIACFAISMMLPPSLAGADEGKKQLEGFQDIKLGMPEDQLLKSHPELKLKFDGSKPSAGIDAAKIDKTFRSYEGYKSGSVVVHDREYKVSVSAKNQVITAVILSSELDFQSEESCLGFLDRLGNMVSEKYGQLDGPAEEEANEWVKSLQARKTIGDRIIDISVIYSPAAQKCNSYIVYAIRDKDSANPL